MRIRSLYLNQKTNYSGFKNTFYLTLLLFVSGIQLALAQVETPIQTETFISDEGLEIEMNVYNNLGTLSKQMEESTNSNFSSLTSVCNTDSELYAENISQGGSLDSVGCNYASNDTIQICIRINNFNSATSTNNCQYFHGLVPDFGECLNVLPTPTGEPGWITEPMTNLSGSGQWEWFPDEVVLYNNIIDGYYPPGTPVGAGWFYIYNPGNNPACTDYSNPNCTWGDGIGCLDDVGSWEVCFIAYPQCDEFGIEELCEVSFRTFSDGETGGWDRQGCEADSAVVYDFTTTCDTCIQPVILNEDLEFTVCSGDLFTLDLVSNMDPETSYEIIAHANDNGASSQSGTTISDVLINDTDNPVTVTYEVFPTCSFGCEGEPVIVIVTILPGVDFSLTGINWICIGECTSIDANVQGNGGPFTYEWNTGQTGSSITDCPYQSMSYFVTVTNSFGCTAVEGFDVFVDDPIPVDLIIEASDLSPCESELPVTLTAFTFGGSFNTYEWSTGEYSSSINVLDPGTYSVTVVNYDYCYETYAEASISIIVHPQPELTILGPTEVCIDEGQVCFEASPVGGIWSNTNGAGCIDPQALGVGEHSVSYFYEDANGCNETIDYIINIIENPVVDIEGYNQLCIGDCTTLNATVEGIDGPFTYEWNTGETTSSISDCPYQNMSYSVTVTNNYGCSSFAGFNVNVEEPIPVSVIVEASETNLCESEFPVMLTAFATGGSSNDFEWSTGENSSSIEVYNAGTYSVTVVNYDYCEPTSDDASISIVVHPQPEVTISGPPKICIEEGLTCYEAFPIGGVWNNIDQSGCLDPQALGVGEHTISYFYEDGNGCNETEEYVVEIIETPGIVPVVSCTSTINSVSFFWDSVPDALGYQVNGVFQNTTSYSVLNLNPDETVSITVEVISNNICGNLLGGASCATSACPNVSISLESPPGFCQDANPQEFGILQAIIQGGSGNGIGIWSGAGVISPETGVFSPDVSGVIAGQNEVFYTYEESGCTYTESVFVNVGQTPVVEAGESMTLTCNAEVLSLSGQGTGNPVWTGPGIISGEATNTPSINMPGLYLLTRTDPNSACFSVDDVEIIEDKIAPEAIVSEDQTLTCSEEEVPLISLGNTESHLMSQWQGPGINSTNENVASLMVDLPGEYVLTILNTENGCESEPQFIEVLEDISEPLSTITMLGALDCSGNNVILEGPIQQSVNYEWIAPDGTVYQDLNLETTLAGIYTLQVTNTINGCSSSSSVEVEPAPELPMVNAGINQELTCTSTTVILDGSGSEVNSNFEYLWEGPNGGIIGNADQLNIGVQLSGMYILTSSLINTACSSSDTVYVFENNTAPVIDAGMDMEFGCNDQSLELIGASSIDGDVYQWFNEGGILIANTLEHSIDASGTYTLEVSNSENGCTASDVVLVTINENVPEEINAIATGETCHGDQDGWIAIETVLGGEAPYQYAFEGQDYTENTSWQFLESGTYSLSVMDAQGCVLEQMVHIPETPVLMMDLQEELRLELGQSQMISVNSSINNNSIDTVYWTPEEVVTCLDANCQEVLISPLESMVVEVIMLDNNGCSASGELQLRVDKNRGVFIPNIFSPNTDGINDLFYVQGLESVKEVKRFVVLDRWGAVVFENFNFDINDPEQGWNGQFKDRAASTGTYIYMAEIEFVDGYIGMYKGDVALVK